MIITFFGHAQFRRNEKYKEAVLDFLREKVGKNPVEFYLGGYGEFDAFSYECSSIYKQLNPDALLIFITPYITEEYQKNRLAYVKNRYDAIVYPEIENKPLRYAITYRNRWMVDKSDFVICGIEHSSGGAYKAYRYAKQKNKYVFNITGKVF